MILFRYICREIYLTLLIITLVLVSVVIVNQFSHFLLDVAAGEYGIATALFFTGLQLPLVITYLLSLALFLSILLAIGRLYADHEMTVMSACGMSLLQQTLSIMSLVCLVALFSGWLSLWVNPRANVAMQNMSTQVLHNFNLDVLVSNQFEYFGDTRVVYVEHVSHLKNTVAGLFLAIKNKEATVGGGAVWDIIRAENAYQTVQPGMSDQFIVLQNGSRYNGSAGNKAVTISTFDRYGISLNSPTLFGGSTHSNVISHRHLIPELLTSELYPLIHHDPLAAAEWQLRIAIPISIVISSLVAIALSEVKPRRGRYFALVPALMLYFVYSSTIFLSLSWIQNGRLSIKLGMWWIHGIMLIIVFFLFSYRVGWQRIKQVLGLESSCRY